MNAVTVATLIEVTNLAEGRGPRFGNLPASPVANAIPTGALTDDDLLASMRNGNRRAGDILYRRHAPMLRRIAAARGPKADVEDAVQDAFLILLADPTFRPAPGRLASWLASVVHRRASSRSAQLHDERPTDANAMLEDRLPPSLPRDQEEEPPV